VGLKEKITQGEKMKIKPLIMNLLLSLTWLLVSIEGMVCVLYRSLSVGEAMWQSFRLAALCCLVGCVFVTLGVSDLVDTILEQKNDELKKR